MCVTCYTWRLCTTNLFSQLTLANITSAWIMFTSLWMNEAVYLYIIFKWYHWSREEVTTHRNVDSWVLCALISSDEILDMVFNFLFCWHLIQILVSTSSWRAWTLGKRIWSKRRKHVCFLCLCWEEEEMLHFGDWKCIFFLVCSEFRVVCRSD